MAQNAPERYARVEILLEPGLGIAELAALGIEVDHGLHRPGYSLTTDLAASELTAVRQAGFKAEVHIDDVARWYAARRAENSAAERSGDCGSGHAPAAYTTPANYTYGSMGGYHTLDELYAVLDDMHAKFPNLISVRTRVSETQTTHEGRPLWYVKVSDNPASDETEPEVLYTALHHSREPNGMSQMLFYLWYLLENYETDARVKYIVDNTEMYFIPCLNPDGYVYNETTNPDGGGMWRKNRRDNLDGSFGVDLNRNYAFQWGVDNTGSSPNPTSGTYRGPAAFSEPETQIVRDFGLAHDFAFALNYHTFSNLLIYPWAYSEEVADSAFITLARILTRENGYKYGTPLETVGYPVNGSSDDWMYGTTGAFAYTPEVGLTGFWPSFGEIDALNKENLWANQALAIFAGRYGEAFDRGGPYLAGLAPSMTVAVTRYGLEDGPLTVSVQAVSANIASVSAAQALDLARFQTGQASFNLQLAPGIATGDTVVLVLGLDNGSYVERDTLYKIYGGAVQTPLVENGTALSPWSGPWAVTSAAFVSPPSSITDSPTSGYAPFTDSKLELTTPIALPADALAPRLRFFARWELEEDRDYVQIRIHFADGQVEALCGLYTEPGSAQQAPGQPLYDGEEYDWVEECIDLTPYLGQSVKFSFRLVSDQAVSYDGFYFDDLSVEYLEPAATTSTTVPLENFRLKSEPNPASGIVRIGWENPGHTGGPAELVVTNALGQVVLSRPVELSAASPLELDIAGWAPGMYSYRLRTVQGESAAGKLAVE